MNDLSASERRLNAALERIDQCVDTSRTRRAEALAAAEAARREAEDARAAMADEGPDGLLARMQGANASLAADVEALHARQHEMLAAAEGRLAAAGREAAQLAAANDGLVAANRALIDAAAGGSDAVAAVRGALEAEIEALHAARAAEIAQMGDVLAALDSLLAGAREAGSDDAAGPDEDGVWQDPPQAPPDDGRAEEPAFGGDGGDGGDGIATAPEAAPDTGPDPDDPAAGPDAASPSNRQEG